MSRAEILDEKVELNSEYTHPEWFAVTTDDNVDLPRACRALRCSTGGTVRVIHASGNTSDMAFTDGETRLGMFVRVLATGTTATGIEGGV